MTNATRLQKLAAGVGALLALAGVAGPAAADNGTPSPGGTPPGIVEPSATIRLPLARPGKTATVALRIAGPEATGLRSDGVACAFRFGTQTVSGTPRVSGSDALCLVRVPRSAAGKTVRGAIRVELTHVTIERQFSLKVART